MVYICQFAPYFIMSIFCQCISGCFSIIDTSQFPNMHIWTNFVGIYFPFTIKPVVHCTCTLTIIYIDEENVVRRVEFENVLRQWRHGTILQRGKGNITTCSLYASVYNRLCHVTSFSVVYCHCQCYKVL